METHGHMCSETLTHAGFKHQWWACGSRAESSVKGVTAQNGNTFVWLWGSCPKIAVVFKVCF